MKMPKLMNYTGEARAQDPRAQFPVDMLRYDCCWPTREQDAGLIVQSLRPSHTRPEAPTIRLTRYGSPTPDPFTEARWELFGWTIKEIARYAI